MPAPAEICVECGKSGAELLVNIEGQSPDVWLHENKCKRAREKRFPDAKFTIKKRAHRRDMSLGINPGED